MYRTCRHCGQRVHRVVCYEFGTSDFCEPCATKLGLSQLAEEYEESHTFGDYDPLSDEWYDELNTQLAYHDKQYQQLLTKKARK